MVEYISNEIIVLLISMLFIFYIVLNYIYSKCLTVFSQINEMSIDVDNLSIETNKINETSQKVESNLDQSLSNMKNKSTWSIPKKKQTVNRPDLFLKPEAKLILAKLFEENPEIALKTINELSKEKEKNETDIQHLYG